MYRDTGKIMIVTLAPKQRVGLDKFGIDRWKITLNGEEKKVTQNKVELYTKSIIAGLEFINFNEITEISFKERYVL